MKLTHLFQPIKIGSMVVKNRIAMPPMGSNLSSFANEITEASVAWYAERAAGGVGLIIVEDTTISKHANYIGSTAGLHDDRLIPGWQDLTKAVHIHGTMIGPQLIHPSFNARAALNDGIRPVAASPIASRFYRELPRELTIDEIHEIIGKFGDAALRAQKAGCDFVQVHCAHKHHLLGSFLSPLFNKRVDMYGGSIEKRLKITLEVIQDIRSKTGEAFPIIVRISGDEHTHGGMTIEDSRYVAKLLEEAGVAAIHVSGGTSDNFTASVPVIGCPTAVHVPQASEIKKAVKIPVIVVGGINTPWLAESVLATGKADMVAIGRSLIADPYFCKKAATEQGNDIRPCVRDMCCLMGVIQDAFGLPIEKISCWINPAAGHESETPIKVETPKNILVIGGGPAGMEVAQVAASRGHKVTIMEKEAKLGGQLLIAAVPPAKQEFTMAVQYLVNQLEKTGVKVELNREVTREIVENFKPDAVVIATGGLPSIPKVSGIDLKNVVTAWDVLSGKVLVSGEVLVIGGGQVGCETADFIAHPDNDMMPGQNRVTIMEMLDFPCMDEMAPQRGLLIERLIQKGVKIITGAKCIELLEDGARYDKGGKEETIAGFAFIVLAMGAVSNNQLAAKLKGAKYPIHVIGDAKVARRAKIAIAEGWEVGRTI